MNRRESERYRRLLEIGLNSLALGLLTQTFFSAFRQTDVQRFRRKKRGTCQECGAVHPGSFADRVAGPEVKRRPFHAAHIDHDKSDPQRYYDIETNAKGLCVVCHYIDHANEWGQNGLSEDANMGALLLLWASINNDLDQSEADELMIIGYGIGDVLSKRYRDFIAEYPESDVEIKYAEQFLRKLWEGMDQEHQSQLAWGGLHPRKVINDLLIKKAATANHQPEATQQQSFNFT